jgi:hypothetical protein
LDERLYPAAALRCIGDPVLGYVSNLPQPNDGPTFYVRAFMGVQPGTCELHDGSFSVTIRIVS